MGQVLRSRGTATVYKREGPRCARARKLELAGEVSVRAGEADEHRPETNSFQRSPVALTVALQRTGHMRRKKDFQPWGGLVNWRLKQVTMVLFEII
jgi:hypothetical protein